MFLRRSALRFIRAVTGATVAEYAILIALIAIVCVAAIQSLEGSVRTAFSNSSNTVATGGDCALAGTCPT